MCHGLLRDPSFFVLLQRIDEELAQEARAAGCACGGVLHRADYPRKPRGCLTGFREAFGRRFSFCCSVCRKRTTSRSVRFLGRRVYVGLALVLASARHAGPMPAPARLAADLGLCARTLQRWCEWWRSGFVHTAWWQGARARFMPPVLHEQLPASLTERFTGAPADTLMRLLLFLSPLSVGRPIMLREGR